MPLKSIRRDDIERFMHDVAAGITAGREKTKPRGVSVVRGGRGVAGRTVRLLGAIFSYAVRNGIRIDNPAHGIVKFAECHRDRRLTDDEYCSISMALSNARREKVWPPTIAATRLMILTGWRRGEVLGLRWSEVDLARRTARLADTKTGASLRPLSEAACAVIQSQPRIGDIVFASRSGEITIVGYRKMWLNIANLGDLLGTSRRICCASLAADLG
jgi:integrase